MKLNIIHIDMDAFYASVEENDNPKLKGQAVIVGGLSERGVVTTANYNARKYGVHSAMPGFIARQKCPHGTFIRPRMSRYREVSNNIFDILYTFTDRIEPLSIDEAYLDISHSNIDSIEIVNSIKQRVLEETGLTMSVGISYNKFLAKVASDWNKPNGIKIITQDMVPDILLPLSVSSVYGIGPKSSKRLNNIGIYNVSDLMQLSRTFLVDFFGKTGSEVYDRIRGIDDRVVETHSERKSIGVERTFLSSTNDKEILISYISEYSKELELLLKNKNLQAKTISLKVKDKNFKTQTRSLTISNHINSYDDIFSISKRLLDEIKLENEIRLLGVSVSNLLTTQIVQLTLFNKLNENKGGV